MNVIDTFFQVDEIFIEPSPEELSRTLTWMISVWSGITLPRLTIPRTKENFAVLPFGINSDSEKSLSNVTAQFLSALAVKWKNRK